MALRQSPAIKAEVKVGVNSWWGKRLGILPAHRNDVTRVARWFGFPDHIHILLSEKVVVGDLSTWLRWALSLHPSKEIAHSTL